MIKTCKRINQKVFIYIYIYHFFNNYPNKFVLLLKTSVYHYQDMDSWEKFDETKIPPKEAFYSKLNLESITDKDDAHV